MKRWAQIAVMTILIALCVNGGFQAHQILQLENQTNHIIEVGETNDRLLMQNDRFLLEKTNELAILTADNFSFTYRKIDQLACGQGRLEAAIENVEMGIEDMGFDLELHKNSVTDIVKQSMPSVVAIYIESATRINLYTGEPLQMCAAGVVINEGGIILTAAHVVDDVPVCDHMWVEFEDGTKYEVTMIAHSSNRQPDVGVIWINPKGRILPAVPMDPSLRENLVKGQEIVIIGTPRGLDFSVATGVISDPNRLTEDPWEVEQIYLHVTAQIVGGNSGGPAFDLEGNFLGIVSWGGSAAQFLVPVDVIMREGLPQCREVVNVQ